MGYAARWDKEAWTVLGQGIDQANIYALAVSEPGKVYVSGEQIRITEGESAIMGFIAQWNGEKWTQIDTNQPDACLSITNIAPDETGRLYASCNWSGPGELIFYWDGMDWTTITDQLGGEAPNFL